MIQIFKRCAVALSAISCTVHCNKIYWELNLKSSKLAALPAESGGGKSPNT